MDALLPQEISVLTAGLVVFASFFTSMLTAAFGLGGGVALLAIMTAVFPPAAVIPVHGVAQFGANLSRFFFLRHHIVWPIIGWFTLGGFVGALFGARLFVAIPPWLLRVIIAGFILYTVWGPKPASLDPGPRTYTATGGVSSFLTMFFGATGPVVAAMLSAAKLDRMQTVSTHAGAMVSQHGLKTLAFGVFGFAFGPWAFVIAGILLAGFAGSWAGAKALRAMPELTFQRGFKIALTLMALYLFGLGVSEALGSNAFKTD